MIANAVRKFPSSWYGIYHTEVYTFDGDASGYNLGFVEYRVRDGVTTEVARTPDFQVIPASIYNQNPRGAP